MRAIILFALSFISLGTHADAIDDYAEAGGRLQYEAGKLYNRAYAIRNRFSCPDQIKGACAPGEAEAFQKVTELRDQARKMVPGNTGLNWSRDQKSLSPDDLMFELFNRVEYRLEYEEFLQNCRPAYCADHRKNIAFYKKTYAEAKAILLDKNGNEIYAKKDAAKPELVNPSSEHAAESLAELKNQNVTMEVAIKFGPLDERTSSAHYANGDCDFKLAAKNGFADYKEVWEVKKPISWKVGEFSPGEKLSRGDSDDQYSQALSKCQSLEPEVRDKCLDILRANGTYQGSGFVLLTSGTKTLAVSSKDNEQGIFECLKRYGFAMPTIQDPSKQTAGDAKAGASR